MASRYARRGLASTPGMGQTNSRRRDTRWPVPGMLGCARNLRFADPSQTQKGAAGSRLPLHKIQMEPYNNCVYLGGELSVRLIMSSWAARFLLALARRSALREDFIGNITPLRSWARISAA